MAERTCLTRAALDLLMPMHLEVSASGRITHAGPTLAKLGPGCPRAGRALFDCVEIRRPVGVANVAALRRIAGERLRLRLRNAEGTGLTGLAVAVPETSGVLLNLSFGITIVDALRTHRLTSSDFAPTDLTVEMLYLSEAQAAVLTEWRKLHLRLEGARSAAEREAATDTLTGLSNRRALEEAGQRLIESSVPFALMVIDLDFFKEVNDTLGHPAGDAVLMSVARVLTEETRQQDTVARVGGDEFVVLFHALTGADALKRIAGRILERLSEPVRHRAEEARISASIGITSTERYRRPDLAQMLADADGALYKSKHEGRARQTMLTEPDPGQ